MMGTKPGSGREDDLKLGGAFCRCADRRYQWVRCGGGRKEPGPPPRGWDLFSAVVQQLRFWAVERGQTNRVCRVRGPLGHLPAPTP